MSRPLRNFGLTDKQRIKMCEGKIRYSDELAARAGGMISLEKHGEENGVEKLYTYRCDACRGYHLTRKKRFGQEPITRPNAEQHDIDQKVAA